MSSAVQASAFERSSSDAPPVVVKLGGSVVRSGSLVGWLDALVGIQRPIVLVPGGGALADEVRDCQRQLGFGDVTAHRMALLAMDQLAWAIAGVRDGCEVGTTEEDLRQSLRRGHIAVWAPSAFLSNRPDVEPTWRLTSDSLALWLAARLEAAFCCVVKSAPISQRSWSATALSDEGIVDQGFPAVLKETGVATMVFGQGDENNLTAFLAGQQPVPSPVTV